MKKVLKGLGILLALILAAALLYVAYIFCSYDRIPDGELLTPQNTDTAAPAVEIGKEYTVVSQNIGFGAYTADFTFFMDGGTESWAASKESVIDCIGQAADAANTVSPDFLLFQEVDFDSTRSYHIDQQALLRGHFGGYSEVDAINYHSAFLAYPFTQPHGASHSSIVTFSKAAITSAVRRSLPISTGVSKFLDLDRCYSVSRIPTVNGKELVLYNVHLSAYGGSAEIASAQMNMLFADMLAEYEKGNYCVCGGDFNHDFTGDSVKVLNGEAVEPLGWTQPFPAELLPDGISRCVDYTCGEQLPTCRNCDIPYEKGNFTVIVDGFLVSDNVSVSYLENIQTDFVYSDHNPVVMRFMLNEQ